MSTTPIPRKAFRGWTISRWRWAAADSMRRWSAASSAKSRSGSIIGRNCDRTGTPIRPRESQNKPESRIIRDPRDTPSRCAVLWHSHYPDQEVTHAVQIFCACRLDGVRPDSRRLLYSSDGGARGASRLFGVRQRRICPKHLRAERAAIADRRGRAALAQHHGLVATRPLGVDGGAMVLGLRRLRGASAGAGRVGSGPLAAEWFGLHVDGRTVAVISPPLLLKV